MRDLSTKHLGIELRSPFVVAASPLSRDLVVPVATSRSEVLDVERRAVPPARRSGASPIDPTASELRRGLPASRGGRRAIHKAMVLWIDDDPLVWARGAEHLARSGFFVTRVRGSANVANLVSEAEPDAVILEVALHDGDGMDLLRSIRTASPSLPIIIYSKTPSYRDDFTSWLADDYLVKCDDLSFLCDAVDAVVLGRDRKVR